MSAFRNSSGANILSRTYISFDTKDSAALVALMKKDGVNIGTCGVRTVRLRPMLIFDEGLSKYRISRVNAVVTNMASQFQPSSSRWRRLSWANRYGSGILNTVKGERRQGGLVG